MGPVCVGAGICHGDGSLDEFARVYFVAESVSRSALTVIRPVVVFGVRIASLDDETLNDAMESNAVVEIVMRELEEVLDGFRGVVTVKLYCDSALAGVHYCAAIFFYEFQIATFLSIA